jgi:outer membrane protein assembly factor BamB
VHAVKHVSLTVVPSRIPILLFTAVVALATTASSPGQFRAGMGIPAPTPVVLWKQAGHGHGQPALDGHSVFFLSADHEVLAFEQQHGRPLWRQFTGEAAPATEGSTLVVSGDLIVAGDYNLVALDRATGEMRWGFVPSLGYAPGIYLGDAVGDRLLAGSPGGRLYAIDRASGRLQWSSIVSADGHTTVFAPKSDGLVVVAGFTSFAAPPTGGVAMFDVESGRQMWRAVFPKAVDPLLGTGFAGGPLITAAFVIASAGDGRIYGFRRTDGTIAWSIPGLDYVPPILRGPFPVPSSSSGADFRPLVRGGDMVIAGSLKGPVVAYDIATQERKWQWVDERSGSVAFAMAGDDRDVFVPLASGRHVAIDAASGRERWRTADAAGQFTWPAAFDATRVYLAGGQGGYVAIRRSR